MNSSGIKRGLAATAISALAITGVPLLSGTAYADSIDAQTGAGAVEIFTQYSNVASTQNDGVNNTVHLLAGGGTDVSQVQFSYTPVGGGADVTIATVSRTNGVFSTEWAPPASTFGNTITVTATGLNTVGTPVGGATDTVSPRVDQNASAVDIGNAAGSALGVFRQLYGTETQENAGQPGAGVSHDTQPGIITGTTSGAGAVTLSDRSNGSRIFPAALATVTPGDATNGVRTYRGAANFADYNVSSAAGAVNQAIVGAQQAGGSDDAEVVNLESQAITTVTATATNPTVNQGQTTSAVVTVTDAQGRPLAGAQVIQDTNRDGIWTGAGADGIVADDAATANVNEAADNEISSYTNALGQSTFTGLAGSAAGTTYDFFVNVDDDDDYQAAKDFRRSVTVTSQAQNTATLTSSSADGAAFDNDEYALGDLAVQVNDQNGAAVPAGRNVSYSLAFTPAATTATPNPVTTTTTGTATTGANGRAPINIPEATIDANGNGTYVLNAFIESNGTPGQQAGDTPAAAPLTFKAGDSTLAFTEAPTATSISGTTDTYEASLRLFDGTALAGRAITFAYSPTGNSVVAAQAAQPTGTTRTGDGAATATTNAQGTASVAVSDPATPDQAELGNTLNAATSTNTIGNAAEAAAPLNIDFVDGTPPANSTVAVTTDDIGTPGAPVFGTATVTTDDTDPATPANPQPVGAGLAVTLTVSGNAFFTDGDVVPGGTVGQPATIDNDGKTKTFVTNGSGQVQFATSIGRDTGFDDDGQVTVTVSAASGTGTGAVSGTDTQVYDADNLRNGGEVQLVQSPDQDNPTDPTRAGSNNNSSDRVNYDVVTTDQFGNPVEGQFVNVSITGAGNQNNGFGVISDRDDDGDFSVGADEAGTVTLTATWNAPRNFVYATPTTTTSTAPVQLTDTATEEFYDVDFAASTYTITSSPEGQVPVGSAVTEAVTVVDQEGNPVQGLYVQFIRSGPGDQTGDTNSASFTNANGQAFYTFAGTQAGTAQINAVVSEQPPFNGGSGEPLATLTDSVVFVATPGGGGGGTDPVQSTATISGPNNGAKQDRINVSVRPAAAAAGAQVRLFKLVGNQPRQLGAAKRLSSAGKAVFNRKDQNGNGITRYFVRVVGNTKVLGDQSNTKGLR